MLGTLTKLRNKRAQEDKGFTLIELLVVVVILGILIAIAIPLYLNYKRGANDKAAQSDVRSAVSAFEQCNSDGGAYPSAVTSAGAVTGCAQTLNLSGGTTLVYHPASTTDLTNYIVTGTNTGGSGKIYCYSSAAGGSVNKTATALGAAYRAAC